MIDKLAFNGTYEENINLKCFRMYQVYHVTHALFYQDFYYLITMSCPRVLKLSKQKKPWNTYKAITLKIALTISVLKLHKNKYFDRHCDKKT